MYNEFVENYEVISDTELISRINTGEYELLQIIVNRYTPLVRHFAAKYAVLPEDCEELVQDGLFALCNAVKHYEKGQASFSTFASVCIRRAMLSHLKASERKKNIPEHLLSSLDGLEIADSNSPEKIFFDKEDYRSLTDTIKLELSSLEYKVLLSFLSGKNYSGIAEELDIPVKSVDNSLKRIRKKLKSNKS